MNINEYLKQHRPYVPIEIVDALIAKHGGMRLSALPVTDQTTTPMPPCKPPKSMNLEPGPIEIVSEEQASKANAWDQVCNALTQIAPGWHHGRYINQEEFTTAEAAVDLILNFLRVHPRTADSVTIADVGEDAYMRDLWAHNAVYAGISKAEFIRLLLKEKDRLFKDVLKLARIESPLFMFDRTPPDDPALAKDPDPNPNPSLKKFTDECMAAFHKANGTPGQSI